MPSAKKVLSLLTPSPATLVVYFFVRHLSKLPPTIQTREKTTRLLRFLRSILVFLVVVNWRAYPFLWHIKLFYTIPFAKLRWNLAPPLVPQSTIPPSLLTGRGRNGAKNANPPAVVKDPSPSYAQVARYETSSTALVPVQKPLFGQGFSKLLVKSGLMGRAGGQIGKSPFEHGVRIKTVCDWSRADWNMHMSNSSYAAVLDYCRMLYYVDTLGPGLISVTHPNRNKKGPKPGSAIAGALGGTVYMWHKEIPIGAEFELDLKAGGWGRKWFYLVGRYVTKKPKSKGKDGGKGKGKEGENEEEETLHCVAISRYCFKISPSRESPSSSSSPTNATTPNLKLNTTDVSNNNPSGDTNVNGAGTSELDTSTFSLVPDNSSLGMPSSTTTSAAPSPFPGSSTPNFSQSQSSSQLFSTSSPPVTSSTRHRRSRLTVPPGRVLSLSGYGANTSNWERALRLSRVGGGSTARDWALLNVAGGATKESVLNKSESARQEEWWKEEDWDGSDGMEGFEEERRKRTEAFDRMFDTGEGLK